MGVQDPPWDLITDWMRLCTLFSSAATRWAMVRCVCVCVWVFAVGSSCVCVDSAVERTTVWCACLGGHGRKRTHTHTHRNTCAPRVCDRCASRARRWSPARSWSSLHTHTNTHTRERESFTLDCMPKSRAHVYICPPITSTHTHIRTTHTQSHAPTDILSVHA